MIGDRTTWGRELPYLGELFGVLVPDLLSRVVIAVDIRWWRGFRSAVRTVRGHEARR